MIASVATIAAIWAAIWARRAALHTKDTADVAKDALAADQRPWLSVSHSLSPPGYMEPSIAITVDLDCSVTNHGRIPAVNVRVWSTILINPDAASVAKYRAFCEDAAAHFYDVPGAVVFPNAPVTLNTRSFRFKLEIERDMKERPSALKAASAELWLVVTYRFAGSDEPHFTPYRYHLLASPNFGELDSHFEPESLPDNVWLHAHNTPIAPT